MSKIMKKGATTPEMNITPMIDVCFQLIIFFMITAKIVQDEAVKMVVPKVIRPMCEKLPDSHRLVVNIVDKGYYTDTIRHKEVLKEMEKHRNGDNLLEAMAQHNGRIEAVAIKGEHFMWPKDGEEMQKFLKEEKDRRDSEKNKLEVVVRAGMNVQYKNVLPVLGAITGVGLEKVNLSALRPDE